MWTQQYTILLGIISALALAQAENPFLASGLKILPSENSKARVCFKTADVIDVQTISDDGGSFSQGSSRNGGSTISISSGAGQNGGYRRAGVNSLLVSADTYGNDPNSYESNSYSSNRGTLSGRDNGGNDPRDGNFGQTQYDGQQSRRNPSREPGFETDERGFRSQTSQQTGTGQRRPGEDDGRSQDNFGPGSDPNGNRYRGQEDDGGSRTTSFNDNKQQLPENTSGNTQNKYSKETAGYNSKDSSEEGVVNRGSENGKPSSEDGSLSTSQSSIQMEKTGQQTPGDYGNDPPSGMSKKDQTYDNKGNVYPSQQNSEPNSQINGNLQGMGRPGRNGLGSVQDNTNSRNTIQTGSPNRPGFTTSSESSTNSNWGSPNGMGVPSQFASQQGMGGSPTSSLSQNYPANNRPFGRPSTSSNYNTQMSSGSPNRPGFTSSSESSTNPNWGSPNGMGVPSQFASQQGMGGSPTPGFSQNDPTNNWPYGRPSTSSNYNAQMNTGDSYNGQSTNRQDNPNSFDMSQQFSTNGFQAGGGTSFQQTFHEVPSGPNPLANSIPTSANQGLTSQTTINSGMNDPQTGRLPFTGMSQTSGYQSFSNNQQNGMPQNPQYSSPYSFPGMAQTSPASTNGYQSFSNNLQNGQSPNPQSSSPYSFPGMAQTSPASTNGYQSFSNNLQNGQSPNPQSSSPSSIPQIGGTTGFQQSLRQDPTGASPNGNPIPTNAYQGLTSQTTINSGMNNPQNAGFPFTGTSQTSKYQSYSNNQQNGFQAGGGTSFQQTFREVPSGPNPEANSMPTSANQGLTSQTTINSGMNDPQTGRLPFTGMSQTSGYQSFSNNQQNGMPQNPQYSSPYSFPGMTQTTPASTNGYQSFSSNLQNGQSPNPQSSSPNSIPQIGGTTGFQQSLRQDPTGASPTSVNQGLTSQTTINSGMNNPQNGRFPFTGMSQTSGYQSFSNNQQNGMPQNPQYSSPYSFPGMTQTSPASTNGYQSFSNNLQNGQSPNPQYSSPNSFPQIGGTTGFQQSLRQDPTGASPNGNPIPTNAYQGLTSQTTVNSGMNNPQNGRSPFTGMSQTSGYQSFSSNQQNRPSPNPLLSQLTPAGTNSWVGNQNQYSPQGFVLNAGANGLYGNQSPSNYGTSGAMGQQTSTGIGFVGHIEQSKDAENKFVVDSIFPNSGNNRIIDLSNICGHK
ncbi:Hypothetical protein NTJ_05936 [Nesidiocoris tenuis]|uniref:Uncharacterized protein n=1 Tax=Nesidiocoris tenuis TaxID=355587 RepID=A0ABN7ARX9_9HEMI|nr:Hypothetical protein NTJ_05936 [Nesidiocoris tenuis]